MVRIKKLHPVLIVGALMVEGCYGGHFAFYLIEHCSKRSWRRPCEHDITIMGLN